jgi:hypothetical protein
VPAAPPYDVTSGERAPAEADRTGPPPLEPRRVFLTLCLLAGASLALLIPPLASPDERSHLARAYLIAEGTLLPPADTPSARASFPRSFVALDRRLALQPAGVPPRKFRRAEIAALFDQPLRPDARVPALALSYYTPLAYLPQAAAMALLRPFEPAPVLLAYAGRLANLAAYAALGWLALALAPVGRWPLCLLLLLPMAVSGAASLSCDGTTLAVAALFAALASRAAWGPEPLADARTRGALAASGAALGLAKPGYWLVAALALWIPARRFPDTPARVRALASVAAAVAVPYLLWGGVLAAHGVSAIHPPADPPAQLACLARAPWELAAVLGRTLAEGFAGYVEGFVGILGRLCVHLPTPLWMAAPLVLAGAALAEPRSATGPGARACAGLAALFAAGVALVFLLAYVSVNPPGSPYVNGVQGRYLLPLAPIALLAIPARGPSGSDWDAARARGAALWSALLLGAALHSVWRAYYAGA